MENNEDKQVLVDKRSLIYLFEKSNELMQSVHNNSNKYLIGSRAGSLHTEMSNIIVPLISSKPKIIDSGLIVSTDNVLDRSGLNKPNHIEADIRNAFNFKEVRGK